jgi:hypothetical protein
MHAAYMHEMLFKCLDAHAVNKTCFSGNQFDSSRLRSLLSPLLLTFVFESLLHCIQVALTTKRTQIWDEVDTGKTGSIDQVRTLIFSQSMLFNRIHSLFLASQRILISPYNGFRITCRPVSTLRCVSYPWPRVASSQQHNLSQLWRRRLLFPDSPVYPTHHLQPPQRPQTQAYHSRTYNSSSRMRQPTNQCHRWPHLASVLPLRCRLPASVHFQQGFLQLYQQHRTKPLSCRYPLRLLLCRRLEAHTEAVLHNRSPLCGQMSMPGIVLSSNP